MIKRNKDIILRNIHDIYFLVDIGANYLNEKCTLYEVNPVGAFVWDALERCSNIPQIADELLAQLTEPVDKERICNDISAFINVIEEQGFIEVIG